METKQLELAETVVPQVVLCVKSAGFSPMIEKLFKEIGALPLLDKTTFCEPALVKALVGGNVSADGPT
jgi:hypothetical protein